MVLSLGFLTAMFWNQPVYRNYKLDGKGQLKDLKIIFLSDLHNSIYGKNQSKLLKMIDDVAPDLILCGGDMSDERTSMTGSILLFEGLKDRYPVYYVSGNHEHWMYDSDEVFSVFEDLGVIRLSNEKVQLTFGEEKVTLLGVDDPDSRLNRSAKVNLTEFIDTAVEGAEDGYKVLLSHRPEHAKLYSTYDIDLALSGHAHGGQVRIPGILNGLYAPNQSFFPKYPGGYYDIDGNMDFIVGRGLSLKKSLPRIFNPPEVVVIEFE